MRMSALWRARSTERGRPFTASFGGRVVVAYEVSYLFKYRARVQGFQSYDVNTRNKQTKSCVEWQIYSKNISSPTLFPAIKSGSTAYLYFLHFPTIPSYNILGYSKSQPFIKRGVEYFNLQRGTSLASRKCLFENTRPSSVCNFLRKMMGEISSCATTPYWKKRKRKRKRSPDRWL